MAKWCWETFGNISQALDVWSLLKLGLVLASGAITGLTGYIQGAPVMHIWVGFLAALGFSALALDRLTTWLRRITPKGKLQLQSIEWSLRVAEDGKSLAHILPKIHVRNLSDFPLSFRIKKLEWRVENRVPPPVDHPDSDRAVMEPGGAGHYVGMAADLSGMAQYETLNGMAEVELAYGKPNRETISWSRKYRLKIRRVAVDPSLGAQQFVVEPRETT